MVRTSGRSRGCRPCRQRRIKCDEAEPECGQCVRRGQECPGPLRGLIVFESQPKNPTKFRHVVDDRVKAANSSLPLQQDQRVVTAVAPDGDRVLGPGAPDPFSSFIVPLSWRTNEHFQHFMMHTVRCCWPFRPEVLGFWCGQRASAEPAIFYGMISMSASHRFHLDYEHQTKDPVAPRWMLQALESRANIIRTIKETINDIGASDIESIAVMIAMLICVEASNGNIAEMDTHIAGLQKLIQTFGSIDDFDLSTISFLMGVDILWAIVKCASPALPLAAKYLEYALNQPALTVHYYDHPDGDFSDWQAEKSFHSLGSRFANSSWARLLDRSLRTAIRNFRNLIIHYETDENRQQRERVAAFEDNNPWNISQRFVLSLSYEHLGPGDIREPLRRSMLAYSMTRYCKFGAFPCMDVVAGSLRDSIVPRLDTLLSTAPDLLFWILYAGALTARKSSEHYTWFCTELGGVSSMLDIFCWNDARSLLEQFFFCHRLSDQSAEKTWQDIGSFMAKDLCIRHSKNLGSQDMLSEYK